MFVTYNGGVTALAVFLVDRWMDMVLVMKVGVCLSLMFKPKQKITISNAMKFSREFRRMLPKIRMKT